MQQWLKLKRWKIHPLQRQKIQLLPSEDRATLAVCIGIALFFWLLVKLSRTYVSEKSVLLQYELPSGKTFTNKPPTDMSVQLQGRGWELMFDYLYDPKILLSYDLLELNALNLSSMQLRSDIARKIAFSSIRVVDIDRDIQLQLEEGASKKVPVVVIDSLTFAAGYRFVQPLRAEPDSIVIKGPISLLNKIYTWKTVPFLLKNLKNNVVQTIPLEMPPPELTLNVTQVQAAIEVEQITEKSMFIRLNVRNPPTDSVKYFPETVKITCTIGLSSYNKIDTSDFAVEIDLSKVSLKQGKHTVPIQMTRQPLEVLSVHFTPKSAEFFLFKR